ncbi:hypothetical protein THARTR1_01273 [Trichoderma harzianum]|uniref:BZIP domain-containing protein n=1 Tax=Trichoderma harzianum TaxID=5544 RepID=A0A2K0UMP4_TRIHA|nr:hypothetical protein THARTR1_01273 [Trichoderma harzianum]
MSASSGKAADATADTGEEARTKRRPGRPRMKDSLPADPNDNSRRSRMRLAQRSYRSRKENELATTKARADALQKALNNSLDEFIRFHELSSGKERDLPSEFVLQLNKTAMNIMAIARSAQADEWPAFDQADRLLATMTDSHGKDDDSIYILSQEAQDASSHLLRPKPVTISQRLMRACVDRAADILNLTSSPVMCLLPAMLLPLQFDRRDNLLSRTMRYVHVEDDDLELDAEHSPMASRHLPRMLRLIEGQSSSMVPRMAPPNLQRLQFGRTRTVLSTALPDLQGEWLEASDVEEYLEQRGIFIRQDSPNTDMLNLAVPLDVGLAVQTTDLNDVNRLNPVRLVRQSNPAPLTCSNTSTSTGTSAATFVDPLLMPADSSSFGTFAANPDYTVFGQQRDVQVVPSGMKMFTPTSWATQDAHALPMDMAMHHQNNPEHINIMFNLDNLIMRLAAKAVCLGPCPGIRRAHVDEAIRDSVVQMPPM